MERHSALTLFCCAFLCFWLPGGFASTHAFAQDGSCGLSDGEILRIAYPSAREAPDGTFDVDGATVSVAEVNYPSNRAWWILCKKWPSNPHLTLVAVPLTTEASSDLQVGDLEVIVFDNASNVIQSRLRMENALTSDAIVLERMSFDTALYRLAPGRTAFGIRKYYSGSSQGNPFSMTSLSLFVDDGSALRQVLGALAVEQSNGEYDGDCAGHSDDHKRTLAIGKDSRHGFADLVVTTVSTLTETKFDATGQCVDVYAGVNKANYKLTYDGQGYYVPFDMRGF